jgi:integrase
MATKVTLREKPISGNRLSLYLDFYPAITDPKTGKPTRRHFLGMHVYAPIRTTRRKKGKKEEEIHVYSDETTLNDLYTRHNEETRNIAEAITLRKQNELNKPEIYTEFEKERLRAIEQGEKDFLEYFGRLADKRKTSNYDNWVSAQRHLITFANGSLRFADLTEAFCNDFKEYLLNTKSNRSDKATLSQNSAVSYFNKLKAALKQAYRDGYLQTDLNAKIEPIKQQETQRSFLAIEEVNRLIKTECNNLLLKRAALFSALTGFRFSDIQNLSWEKLEYVDGDGHFIRFRQVKTGLEELMPISEQAYELLGERKRDTDKVFEGLTYSAHENRHLHQWVKAAGISKHITFHCFRHTYATLQLSEGTPIYTISKMLGHRELKTTQIYAKVMDKAKREATDKIKLDF